MDMFPWEPDEDEEGLLPVVEADPDPAPDVASAAASVPAPARTAPAAPAPASAYLRAANEDDDGYDPYSDRPAAPSPLFERDPWR